MADILNQIQARQLQNQERFVVERQRDLDWRSTFDQIPTDQILRETRNMTDLVNNAIERKMELAAQTDANAQKIFLNNQRFKSWQDSQALRDDKTRASVQAEDALTRSRTAKELLEQSNAARKAREEEETALAQWEMNQIEDNPSATEADKIAQLRSFGGRYNKMDAPTRQRLAEMVSRFTPLDPAAFEAPEGFDVDRVSRNRDGSPNVVFKPKNDVAFPDIASAMGAIPKSTERDFEQTQSGRFLYRPKTLERDLRPAKLQTKLDEELAQLAGHEESLRTAKAGLIEKYTAAAAGAKARANLYKTQIEAARAPAAAAVKQAQTPQEWLEMNPNDPRAAAIRAKLGIK